MFKLYECSPEAKEKIKVSIPEVSILDKPMPDPREIYPLSALLVGQCFTVAIVDCNYDALRVAVSKRSKKLNRKFCVLKHKELNLIEVARIE